MARPISLMIDGWMPSVGSSSTSSFGRITSARPMASCCCWPPDRSPPRRPSICFSTGNSSNTWSGTVRSARFSGAKPEFQVLAHASAAERSPCPAARMRCPTGRDRTPRSGRAPSPRRLRFPMSAWRWPTIDLIKLVLPTPLRPSTQVILPAAGLQRDAAQRLGGAVVEGGVGDFEHQRDCRPSCLVPRCAPVRLRGGGEPSARQRGFVKG